MADEKIQCQCLYEVFLHIFLTGPNTQVVVAKVVVTFRAAGIRI